MGILSKHIEFGVLLGALDTTVLAHCSFVVDYHMALSLILSPLYHHCLVSLFSVTLECPVLVSFTITLVTSIASTDRVKTEEKKLAAVLSKANNKRMKHYFHICERICL